MIRRFRVSKSWGTVIRPCCCRRLIRAATLRVANMLAASASLFPARAARHYKLTSYPQIPHSPNFPLTWKAWKTEWKRCP